jgi:hypothetical protein
VSRGFESHNTLIENSFGQRRDRCYNFINIFAENFDKKVRKVSARARTDVRIKKNIFAEKFGKKLAVFFAQTSAIVWKKDLS